MQVGLDSSLLEWLTALAAPERAPAGSAAAGIALCTGLSLFLKALQNPPPDVGHAAAAGDIELLRAIRQRALKQLSIAQGGEDALPAQDEAGDPVLRLSAFRATRNIFDLSLQALAQIKPVLDRGGVGFLPDLELAWRLIAAAMEGSRASCENHLRHLPATWTVGEGDVLAQQAKHGQELQSRAYSEMAWRLRRL
jgi:hypothetical protein